MVLRNTLALVEHAREIELSIRNALVGRLAITAQRSLIVLRDTPTFLVHDAKLALSTGVPLISSELIKPRGRVFVPRQTPKAALVKEAEIALSIGVVLVGGELEESRGLLIVLRQAASALRVKTAELVLRPGVSLVGGELEEP